MPEVKWNTTVCSIGPEVSAFLEENILVLFDTTAPEELADFAVLHPQATLHAEIEPGDLVQIGESYFRVTAVGPVANKNLASLGHVVFKCNGRKEVEMPGDVCLEEAALPTIEIGMPLRVLKEEESEA